MIGWLAVAAAADPAPALLLRTETASALRPDAAGDPVASLAERLVLQAPVAGGWQLGADGGVRLPTGDPDARVDLWQLQLGHHAPRHALVAGRHHRLDPRGFQQLDGVSALADDGGDWGAQAWAGRMWDSELWVIPDVWVGGLMVTRRPAPGARLQGGLEARSVDGTVQPRAFVAAAADTVRGDRTWGLLEVSDDALNARLDGLWAATRRWDLGAGLRWEGLAPARGPRTPYELLAPDGYGLAEGRAAWRHGAVQLRGAGGVTWVSDRQGGSGRLSAALGNASTSAGVYARAASIGASALAGGGVELRPQPAWLLDGGLYRLQPLDGDAGWVWEVRGRGTTPGPRIGAAVDAAAYGNATLGLGLRAGLLLRAGSPPLPGVGGRP